MIQLTLTYFVVGEMFLEGVLEVIDDGFFERCVFGCGHFLSIILHQTRFFCIPYLKLFINHIFQILLLKLLTYWLFAFWIFFSLD